MHYTLEKLLEGDEEVIGYYQTAKNKWGELLAENRDGSVSDWARWLTMEQHFFEQECGSRWVGQEIMVWSGFAALYTTTSGFDENWPLARKLAGAFERSMCSIEVKSTARRAAASYSVDDDPAAV